VVGIVLHIQTNQGLRNTVHNGKRDRGATKDPQVLETEEETNVKKATEEPTIGSKFFSSANNLEDFLLDFTLEFSIELVSVTWGGGGR
jgi:hypothetical protein